MEKFKDLKRINQMLDKGEITCLDIESGYRYSLCAICKNDGNECSVASFERNIGEKTGFHAVHFLQVFRLHFPDLHLSPDPEAVGLKAVGTGHCGNEHEQIY